MHIPQRGLGVQRAVRTPASLLLTHPCPHSPVPTSCLCHREDSRDPTWAGLGGRAHLAQGCCPELGWTRLPGHEVQSPIRSAPCSKCLLRITCACSSVQIQWDPVSACFLGAAQPSMGMLGITGLEWGTVPTQAELGFLSMCTTGPTPTHESGILSLSLSYTHTLTYAHTRTLIHTHRHAHTDTYTCSHVHRHPLTQIHTETQTHTLSYIHTQTLLHTHTHTFSLIYTQIHTQSYFYTHMLIHTRSHRHTHTVSYTHRHTHTRSHRHTLSHTHTQTLLYTHTRLHRHSLIHIHGLSHVHTHSYIDTLSHTHRHTHSFIHTHRDTHIHSLTHTHSLSLSHTQTHTVRSRAHRVRIQVQAALALTSVRTGPPLFFLRGLSPAAPAAARIPRAWDGTHPCCELSWEPGAPWHQRRRPPALTDLLRTAGT